MTFAPQSLPPTCDPLTPAGAFAIDWTRTGYRESSAPTDPQPIVTLGSGRWINDSGVLVTTAPVNVALADGANAIQLDRAPGAIVADTAFNADSLPLYVIETEAATHRIVRVIDVRGLPGLPG